MIIPTFFFLLVSEGVGLVSFPPSRILFIQKVFGENEAHARLFDVFAERQGFDGEMLNV
jgi:hypothetical protein